MKYKSISKSCLRYLTGGFLQQSGVLLRGFTTTFLQESGEGERMGNFINLQELL